MKKGVHVSGALWGGCLLHMRHSTRGGSANNNVHVTVSQAVGRDLNVGHGHGHILTFSFLFFILFLYYYSKYFQKTFPQKTFL